jgi:hypothetical protein
MTSNPVSTRERDTLRKAIAERDAAKEVVRLASEAAERGKKLLQSARTKLEQFGDVDDAILKHRAASYKNAAQGGPKPTLALPEELVRRERARDEAASAVAAAKAAHTSLAGEFAASESALRKAESRVSELAGAVLVAETAELGSALTTIWNDLWSTIDNLNALRSALRVTLPPEIIRTLHTFETMDHRMFAGGRNPQSALASQYWKAFHKTLCNSADATEPEPEPNHDGVSSTVVERVA